MKTMNEMEIGQIAAGIGLVPPPSGPSFPRPDDSMLREQLRKLAEQQMMEELLEILGRPLA